MDPLDAGQRSALASAEPTPWPTPCQQMARPQPPWPQNAPGTSPLAPESPAEEPALAWCDVCRLWRAHPGGQCAPRPVPQGNNSRPAPDVGATPEPPREDRPRAIPGALAGGTPDTDLASHPPHIDVDASQGTATQLANLMEDDAEGLSLPDVSQLVEDTSDDDPEPPTASPPGNGG